MAMLSLPRESERSMHYRISIKQMNPPRLFERCKMRVSLSCVSLALFLMVTSLQSCTRSHNRELVSAAYRGDAAEIRKLIKEGANPEALAVDDWTPLTIAAREGHVNAVNALIQLGANINRPEGGGNTALFWAAFDDRPEVVQLLLSNGADPNQKRDGGETPLHVAVRLHYYGAATLIRQAGGRE